MTGTLPDVEDLERLLAKATPLNVWAGGGYEVHDALDEETGTVEIGSIPRWDISINGVGSFPIGRAYEKRDADLIATAVNALPTLLSALREARAGGWRPIETAPKDGTAILAWCVHPYASSMTQPADYVGPVVAYWIDHNGGGWTWHGHLGNFTHWMPLPSPPAIRALDGE